MCILESMEDGKTLLCSVWVNWCKKKLYIYIVKAQGGYMSFLLRYNAFSVLKHIQVTEFLLQFIQK